MASRQKPRCFVAMAFEHDDTEVLYEKSIKPVLKSNGVIPVIINRRNDNRDINQQIIEQLKDCDFAIADLTYARPSVYFEAGYAQRGVGVIYTVRADHLKKTQPDDKRIHFDLQMKPLIEWRKPDDERFRRSLEKRLKNTVLRDWKRKLKEGKREKQEIAEFISTPLQERLVSLRHHALLEFFRCGFNEWYPLLPLFPLRKCYTYRQILKELSIFEWAWSQNTRDDTLDIVSLRIEEALKLKQLRDELGYTFLRSRFPPHLKVDCLSKVTIRRTIEHHILCSLKSIPRTRIMSAMPSLRWDEGTQRYSMKKTYSSSVTRTRLTKKDRSPIELKISVERFIHVYVVCGFDSFKQFQEAMKRVVGQVSTDQQNRSR